jgi:hypothetical protein
MIPDDPDAGHRRDQARGDNSVGRRRLDGFTHDPKEVNDRSVPPQIARVAVSRRRVNRPDPSKPTVA